ncbi:hypothetical protein TNCV_2044611, partial [Trichonephila clavipes]
MKHILLRVAKSAIMNPRRVNSVDGTNRAVLNSHPLSPHSFGLVKKPVQSLRDKFWKPNWSTEHLTHLQTRAKWSVQNPNSDGESARSFK